MAEYRHRETGQVKTQGEWRKHYANVSLPKVWNIHVLNSLKLDPVMHGEQPTLGKYQVAVRDGVVQDGLGNWVEKWIAVNQFATDDEGTKEEKEAAYQASLDANAATITRKARDLKLAESDWTQARDVVLDNDADWKTYRQALRDITSHANFPYLNDEDWPTKP